MTTMSPTQACADCSHAERLHGGLLNLSTLCTVREDYGRCDCRGYQPSKPTFANQAGGDAK